jgi:hypothetical protein
VRVTAKINGDAQDGAGLIANKAKPADKVSVDFRRNPSRWLELLLMAASHTLRISTYVLRRVPCPEQK